jgi:hypothetical protein
VTLTESYAMWPGSSVSGIYIGHPEAYYFGVAKVERDQVEDYAGARAWRSAKSSAGLGRCSTTFRPSRARMWKTRPEGRVLMI